MPRLFGRELSRLEILERVGDIRQVAGARSVELADGPERGVRAVDVRTGGGLGFLVAVDRGMDIADARWGGMPLAWISPTGVTHPAYYEPSGLGWLRGFHGGLLVTCGLAYAGSPSTDEGVELGLHGRASNTPARGVCVREEWAGEKGSEEYVISVSGRVREASVFGPDLELARTVETSLGARSFVVRDRATNLGHEPSPFMILYHMNFGWPLLDDGAEILAPPCEAHPRNEDAASGRDLARRCQAPTAGYREKVYYHDVPASEDGFARVALVNRALAPPAGVAIAWRKAELPNLVQWKMMGRGHYVMGIEPSNCELAGRAAERRRGAVRFLEPGESCELELRVSVLGSAAEIDRFAASVTG